MRASGDIDNLLAALGNMSLAKEEEFGMIDFLAAIDDGASDNGDLIFKLPPTMKNPKTAGELVRALETVARLYGWSLAGIQQCIKIINTPHEVLDFDCVPKPAVMEVIMSHPTGRNTDYFYSQLQGELKVFRALFALAPCTQLLFVHTEILTRGLHVRFGFEGIEGAYLMCSCLMLLEHSPNYLKCLEEEEMQWWRGEMVVADYEEEKKQRMGKFLRERQGSNVRNYFRYCIQYATETQETAKVAEDGMELD